MVKCAIASLAALALAGLAAATAQADEFGYCQNCEIVNGCPVVCMDPNWPSCLTQPPGNRRVCTPGSSFQAAVCVSDKQAANCTYTCNPQGTGYDRGACSYIPIDINQTVFCDFNAGCARGADGSIYGAPKRVTQYCAGSGGGGSVETIGACGDGGCVMRPQCQPGRPCVTPSPTPRSECTPGQTQEDVCSPTGWRRCVPDGSGGYVWEQRKGDCVPGQELYCPGGSSVVCTADCRIPACPAGVPPAATCEDVLGTPSCYPSGAGWACSWKGVVVRLDKPCPTVQRDPFPRGLVGVPMTFRITGGSGTSASNSRTWACDEVHPERNPPGMVCPPPADVCADGRYVTGVRGSATFYSSAADFGNATWMMDERPQNIGMRSDDIVSPYAGHAGRRASQIMGGDLTIRNERRGQTVSHIYETSSYDKPANGPSSNWPAYQVSLKTRWQLVSTWQYQVREWETVCYDNSVPPNECTCDERARPDCALNRRSRPRYVWYPGPTVSYSVDVVGARVPQDAARASICGVIPVGVVQNQAVLQP